ncbi:glycyl radical protein [Christensenella timonensis]|uniref:glycyl radical protein n=1 Tax=Christensenella timonensis TaxID=1816678 RepID=UPI00082DAA87|nr:glycyl radical protein [Christensenella timonensis]
MKTEYKDTYAIPVDRDAVFDTDSEAYARCQRLRHQVVNAKSYICMERARLITQSYKETEGLHPLMRRAKAFEKILAGMSVYILPDEIIVGHQAGKQRSAPLFPEFAVEWIDEEIETFEGRPQDSFTPLKEEIEEYRRDIVPYWKGKTMSDRIQSYITDDIRLERYDANVFSLGLHEDGGLGHVLLDYGMLCREGLGGLAKKCEQKLAGLDMTKPDSLDKRLWYESAISFCKSTIMFAHRYADKALEMAGEEKDAKRREELESIAKVCRRVPEFPAESFHEALQSLWFCQVVQQINDNGVSYTLGRFDQYMYPYYAADIENGVLGKQQAQELLEAFWVKVTEPIKVYREADARIHAGYPMGQNLVIGGIKRDGTDGTNDLSYRCLEAHTHILLMQPNFSVRLHNGTPDEFMEKVAEAIRMGNGMPQILNDEVYIEAMQRLGVTLEDARDYAPVGCVENAPLDAWHRGNGGYYNVAKIAELALNDGVCNICHKQVGPHTGKPQDLKTFDDVKKAYEEQMAYTTTLSVRLNAIVDEVQAELMPIPLTSLLIGPTCLERGTDALKGGAKYNWTAPLGLGVANAGDSLYAVKKVVYDDKKYTIQELCDALNKNFEGEEPMRQYLFNRVEKFGNDEEEVDAMVHYAADVFFDSLEGYEGYHGGPFVGSFVPVAANVAFGYTTAATPDGRLAGTILADGVSPSNGVDKHGPTAALKSVCYGLDHLRCPNGVIFNQKFNPTVIAGEEGLNKFMSLIRSYIKMRGGHVQFNIVSADKLKEAQEMPDKYKSLVVRVAGYSAFFNELSRDVQDSIITRTENATI